MSTAWIITIIVIVVLGVAIFVLFFMGRKAQKQQNEQAKQMLKSSQTMNFYIIDKKKMRLKDANLPKLVLDSADWKTKLFKMPIVKVKAGPKVMNLVSDPDVYKTLLPHQEVKAQVSGIYINSAQRIRGPVMDEKKKKKQAKGGSFIDKLR